MKAGHERLQTGGRDKSDEGAGSDDEGDEQQDDLGGGGGSARMRPI